MVGWVSKIVFVPNCREKFHCSNHVGKTLWKSDYHRSVKWFCFFELCISVTKLLEWFDDELSLRIVLWIKEKSQIHSHFRFINYPLWIIIVDCIAILSPTFKSSHGFWIFSNQINHLLKLFSKTFEITLSTIVKSLCCWKLCMSDGHFRK